MVLPAKIFEINACMHACESTPFPEEFITVISDQRGEEKTVSWETDLQAGEIKRYRVRLFSDDRS